LDNYFVSCVVWLNAEPDLMIIQAGKKSLQGEKPEFIAVKFNGKRCTNIRNSGQKQKSGPCLVTVVN